MADAVDCKTLTLALDDSDTAVTSAQRGGDSPGKAAHAATRTGNHLIVLFGSIQSFLNAGLIFGWPALVVVLQREGAYSELCPMDVTLGTSARGDCEAQRQRFSTLFIVAQAVFSFCAFVVGILLDKLGPRILSSTGSILVTAGLVMLAFSDSKELDMFMPGLSLMCLGGISVHLSWFHVSNLFPSRRKTITSMVVGVFTMSGLVFVVYEALSSAGISAKSLFLGHAAINVLCIVGALTLWPSRPFSLGALVVFRSGCSCSYDLELQEEIPEEIPEEITVTAGDVEKVLEQDVEGGGAAPRNSQLGAPLKATVAVTGREKWTTLPVSQQMLLPSFISNLVFFTLNYLAYTFFLGTALDQLERLGDDPDNRVYLKMFSWLLPLLGGGSVPVIGWILDTKGYTASFVFINTCGVLSATVSMVSNLQLQAFRLVVFSIFRICLFSAMFGYCAVNYGFRSFGRLSGLTLLAASIVSLLGLELKRVVKDECSGDFFLVNLGLCIMGIGCYFHPVYVRKAGI